MIFLILANRDQYSRSFRIGITFGVGFNLAFQILYQNHNVDEVNVDDDGTETRSNDTISELN